MAISKVLFKASSKKTLIGFIVYNTLISKFTILYFSVSFNDGSLFHDVTVTFSHFRIPLIYVLIYKLMLYLSSDGVKWRCLHQLVVPAGHDGCQSGAL